MKISEQVAAIRLRAEKAERELAAIEARLAVDVPAYYAQQLREGVALLLQGKDDGR